MPPPRPEPEPAPWVYAKLHPDAYLAVYLDAVLVAAFYGWRLWEHADGERSWMRPIPGGYVSMGCYCHCTPPTFGNLN